MAVEYSEASIGKVAPVAPPALLSVPSTSTITQLLPVAPGVIVKLKPVKFDALRICASVRPVPPAEVDWPEVVTSQKLALTVAALLFPTNPPTAPAPLTWPVA